MPGLVWRGVRVRCKNPDCLYEGEIREVDVFDKFELEPCGCCGTPLEIVEVE